MSIVNFKFGRPQSDGSIAATPAEITCEPTLKRVVVGTPDIVVLPAPFTLESDLGVFAPVMFPNTTNWCWKITVRIVGVLSWPVYVLVPDVAEIDFTDLVTVNPDTLEPTAAPDALWWAMLAVGLESANPGPAGATGEAGAKGDKGDKGNTGDTGPRGFAGKDGLTPTAADIGLGLVDNTPDAAKPVSGPQGVALAYKIDMAVPVRAIADLQATLDLVSAAGGGHVSLNPGNYTVTATITVPSNIELSSRGATLTSTGNFATLSLVVGATNVTIRNIKFVGTLPVDKIATIQNQVAIKAFGVWDNPITKLKVIHCVFERIQGTAVQMKHVSGFRVLSNDIKHHGYAAIGGSSVSHGLVEDNDVEGTRVFPSYVANTYGIYMSTAEADGPVGTTNPRSFDVMIRNNRIRSQRWSALDTHIGYRISFIGNHIDDCPASAINAVYISQTAGDPNALLSPQDIVIEGNIISYPSLQDTDTSLNMAILLRGSISSDIAARERATGIIKSNIIRRYGRQDVSTSGAIFIGAGLGIIVEGNDLHECRSIGVHVYDCLGTIVTGNAFIDLWRMVGSATAVYTNRVLEPTMDLSVTNNRYVRGRLNIGTDLPAGSVVNSHAIAGVNGPEISVLEGNNEWGAASFATTHTRYQVRTGRLRTMYAAAAPTTGTWIIGEEVMNTAPTPGGNRGWICTTNGTPGIWKTAGVIGA